VKKGMSSRQIENIASESTTTEGDDAVVDVLFREPERLMGGALLGLCFVGVLSDTSL
jgi:hypothetical protein